MFKQIFSGMFSTGEGIPISALEQTLTENNTILLDVREEDEFINGHIPQAKNMPRHGMW